MQERAKYPEKKESDKMQSIGERVAKLRERRSLNQEELAKLLSVKQETICYWEKGKRQIPAEQVGKIATTLNTTCDYLILGKRAVK